MKLLTIIFGFFITYISCYTEEKDQLYPNPRELSTIYASNYSRQVISLGGFSSVSKKKSESICYEATIIFSGSEIREFFFGSVPSTSQYNTYDYDALILEANKVYKLGKLIENEYYSYFVDLDNFNSSLLSKQITQDMVYSHKFKTAFFENYAKNSFSASIFATNDDYNIAEKCGDYLFKEMEMNITFQISLKYYNLDSFSYNKLRVSVDNNEYFRDIFQDNKIRGGTPISASSSLRGNIELTIQQNGGQPNKLYQFLGMNNNGQVTVNCLFTNMSACQSAINSLFTYINGNAFGEQINGIRWLDFQSYPGVVNKVNFFSNYFYLTKRQYGLDTRTAHGNIQLMKVDLDNTVEGMNLLLGLYYKMITHVVYVCDPNVRDCAVNVEYSGKSMFKVISKISDLKSHIGDYLDTFSGLNMCYSKNLTNCAYSKQLLQEINQYKVDKILDSICKPIEYCDFTLTSGREIASVGDSFKLDSSFIKYQSFFSNPTSCVYGCAYSNQIIA